MFLILVLFAGLFVLMTLVSLRVAYGVGCLYWWMFVLTLTFVFDVWLFGVDGNSS